MKRWLLFGTLLAVASLITGCTTCGYGVCGVPTASVYSPCATGGCATRYVSPYAGQFYSGEDCGSCDPCNSCYAGGSFGFRPFARLHRLFSTDCGCACEKYVGDYMNYPPDICRSCDEFGGLAGYVGGCQSGMCDTSYGYASPQPAFASPVAAPFSANSGDCKSCQSGFAAQTPVPSQAVQTLPQPMAQAMPQKIVIVRAQPQMQQPLISRGSQGTMLNPMTQVVVTSAQASQPVILQIPEQQKTPQRIAVNQTVNSVRQVSGGQPELFGTTSKVIQPAQIPANSKVIHAK
ncbi:MAG: hypothetical protein LBJ67_11485 [Planctomycetaceae bacterium]|jgi:hypothetical protein|nr:hypothetical protein [Planctomycetaceae bacterium]